MEAIVQLLCQFAVNGRWFGTGDQIVDFCQGTAPPQRDLVEFTAVAKQNFSLGILQHLLLNFCLFHAGFADSKCSVNRTAGKNAAIDSG